ncbi:MAG TPA: protein kinase [Myxococcales bacterium]|jgi:serine/threonine-protein kinase
MGARLGKYVVRTRLARGGMAELFLATALGPDGFAKTVVLKRLLPHLAENPQIVSMFLEEARLAAALPHPNIVQVFDLGRQGEDPYICMEYLAGKDLAAVGARSREQGRPVPVEIAAQLCAGIAQGLQFAHERGVVHGDVSPANVVVTFVGEVKLVDFGIAKAGGTAQGPFPGGSVQGKLAYLAPEQIQRGVCDRRGDVFALGVVLHELLTGERLFRRDSDAATIEAIVREPIPDPRERRGGIPERLAAATMRALERDPSRRFATADELRIALEGAMAERCWLPTSTRLGCWLTHLFGDADARQALSPPIPAEPTATTTDAAAAPALVAPVDGVTAVRLFAEARRRGTRQLVRVVGEVPAALMKAGQELVAVPLHFVQSAQRFTRGRVAGAALGLSLIGFGLGLGLREAREALGVAAVEPPVEPPAKPGLTSPPSPPETDLAALVDTDRPPPARPALAPAPPSRRSANNRPGRGRTSSKLGRLELAVRGTVLFQGLKMGQAPFSRAVPPGSYTVTLVSADGTQRTWIAVVRAGQTTRLTASP